MYYTVTQGRARTLERLNLLDRSTYGIDWIVLDAMTARDALRHWGLFKAGTHPFQGALELEAARYRTNAPATCPPGRPSRRSCRRTSTARSTRSTRSGGSWTTSRPTSTTSAARSSATPLPGHACAGRTAAGRPGARHGPLRADEARRERRGRSGPGPRRRAPPRVRRASAAVATIRACVRLSAWSTWTRSSASASAGASSSSRARSTAGSARRGTTARSGWS